MWFRKMPPAKTEITPSSIMITPTTPLTQPKIVKSFSIMLNFSDLKKAEGIRWVNVRKFGDKSPKSEVGSRKTEAEALAKAPRVPILRDDSGSEVRSCALCKGFTPRSLRFSQRPPRELFFKRTHPYPPSPLASGEGKNKWRFEWFGKIKGFIGPTHTLPTSREGKNKW